MLPKKQADGFTLIELLVVIAIIGLLSTLAIVALGTARQKSRDARRLADLRQIQTALEMYNSDTGNYPVTSTILLGDTDHACLGSGGFGAAGACTGQFISFPRDPAGGYYLYSGTATDYTLAATLEGTVGDLSGSISASANAGAQNCPSLLYYSGQTYGAITLGSQCWLKQNLNVGTMLASAATSPSDDGEIEKWCFNNDPGICDTDGGLYSWAEANQLGTSCDAATCTVPTINQGICPAGWHIPTDQEFMSLEMYLGMSAASTTLTAWRGTDQGTQLKIGGSSGFEFILTGDRNPNSGGSYNSRTSASDIWLASQGTASSTGWRRHVNTSEARVYRSGDMLKTFGFPVRCLKN